MSPSLGKQLNSHRHMEGDPDNQRKGSHGDDFEEVVLVDDFDEVVMVDDFEEVVLVEFVVEIPTSHSIVPFDSYALVEDTQCACTRPKEDIMQTSNIGGYSPKIIVDPITAFPTVSGIYITLLGLWYPKESPFNLVAYSDSDYGGASQDRKSTTEGCQFLGRRLISWQCKKQIIVATSTTEAEYVAAASGCGQVLWIQNQLLDYGEVSVLSCKYWNG
nr:putative ribonuclease H-like domain-containing protein [Tanacetum cinerariifolium]